MSDAALCTQYQHHFYLMVLLKSDKPHFSMLISSNCKVSFRQHFWFLILTKIFYSSFFHIILVFLYYLWKYFCNNFFYIPFSYFFHSQKDCYACFVNNLVFFLRFFFIISFYFLLIYLLTDNNFVHILFFEIFFFFLFAGKKTFFHFLFNALYKHYFEYLLSLLKIDLINIIKSYIIHKSKFFLKFFGL